MVKYKISTVSYLNTIPFIYGLKNSPIFGQIELSLDFPALCADKLIRGEVDIALVPVAVIPQLENAYIISVTLALCFVPNTCCVQRNVV